MINKHFIVHRDMDNATMMEVHDMLEELLAMSEVDHMKLVSTFVFVDKFGKQHLYLIFNNE